MSDSRRRGRRPAAGRAFDRLVRIMAILRSPRGCPWDRKQTHRTLARYLIEETYEAVDAIDRDDMDDLCDELGDVLLQVVFHAELAAGAKRFTVADVIAAITDKLIRRHPHVFTAAGRPLTAAARARASASTPGAVTEQWQRIKASEGSRARQKRSHLLDGVPRALPGLMRASSIGSRVAGVGFDWPRAMDVVDKIDEEVRELREALQQSDARAADELGDVLFSIANLARKLKVDPEAALRHANDKFTRRFAALERHLAGQGRPLPDASADEMEAAWNAVKDLENRSTGRRTPLSGAQASGKLPSTTSGRRRSSRQRVRRPSR